MSLALPVRRICGAATRASYTGRCLLPIKLWTVGDVSILRSLPFDVLRSIQGKPAEMRRDSSAPPHLLSPRGRVALLFSPSATKVSITGARQVRFLGTMSTLSPGERAAKCPSPASAFHRKLVIACFCSFLSWVLAHGGSQRKCRIFLAAGLTFRE